MPLGALLLALVAGGIIILLMGINPIVAYGELFRGAFGSWVGISETLLKAAPLLFTGLSFAVGSRGGLFNIGAEGQLYLGGLGSIAVALWLTGLPTLVHLPLTLLAGAAAGGALGALAGFLKERFGASELITTIMFNYVGVGLVSYMVTGPLMEPGAGLPQTAVAPVTAQLMVILPGTRLHLGFVLGILMVIVYWIVVWKTAPGYRVRVAGLNPLAARYAGIDASRLRFWVMAASGAVAGLAGANEILGVQRRLMETFSPGYGYDGIAVALIGRNNPVGVILGALLFGALRSGANAMQMTTGVPVAIIYIIQGLVIALVAGGTLLADQSLFNAMKKSIRDATRPTPEQQEV